MTLRVETGLGRRASAVSSVYAGQSRGWWLLTAGRGCSPRGAVLHWGCTPGAQSEVSDKAKMKPFLGVTLLFTSTEQAVTVEVRTYVHRMPLFPGRLESCECRPSLAGHD